MWKYFGRRVLILFAEEMKAVSEVARGERPASLLLKRPGGQPLYPGNKEACVAAGAGASRSRICCGRAVIDLAGG